MTREPQVTNTYYQHITELPLRKYIDVAVNGNLAALVISGFPSQEELAGAWSELCQQYADSTGDGEYLMYHLILRDSTCLQIDINLVQNGVKIMSVMYVPETAKILNKICDIDFKFDPADPEKYAHELKRCLNRIKTIELRYEIKKRQADSMEAKFKDGKKPTAEYYHSILITLSDHAKIPLDDSITVYQFCERLRRFNKYCETANKK